MASRRVNGRSRVENTGELTRADVSRLIELTLRSQAQHADDLVIDLIGGQKLTKKERELIVKMGGDRLLRRFVEDGFLDDATVGNSLFTRSDFTALTAIEQIAKRGVRPISSENVVNLISVIERPSDYEMRCVYLLARAASATLTADEIVQWMGISSVSASRALRALDEETLDRLGVEKRRDSSIATKVDAEILTLHRRGTDDVFHVSFINTDPHSGADDSVVVAFGGPLAFTEIAVMSEADCNKISAVGNAIRPDQVADSLRAKVGITIPDRQPELGWGAL